MEFIASEYLEMITEKNQSNFLNLEMKKLRPREIKLKLWVKGGELNAPENPLLSRKEYTKKKNIRKKGNSIQKARKQKAE